jgi:hypothetical protein
MPKLPPGQIKKGRTSFYIDQHLLDGLTQLKKRDGMPASEALRRAISAFLKGRGIKVTPIQAKSPRKAKKR